MAQIYDEKGNPIDAYDEDLNPIDVFDQKETDEKVEEKAEEAKATLEEKLGEKETAHESVITKKDEEIEQIKADIKTGEEGDKAKNLTGLRKKLEETEEAKTKDKEEFETYKKETDEKITKIHGAVSSKKVDDAIKEVVGDDKEMADKVRIHFNRIKPLDTADAEKIEEDFGIRMKEAVILAGGGQPANVIQGVAATEGGYIPAPAGQPTAETPEGELKDMMTQKMGVTEKEIRDHKKAKEQ